MIVEQDGRFIPLANYRYPCQTKKRKGIIFFVHGNAEYTQRYAYLAKVLAEAGFDFVGIDQRGYGFSAGTRGFLESEEQYLSDLKQHIKLID